MPLPQARQEEFLTPHGPVIGASYAWEGGQYCAIHTARGVVGCGLYDVACADEFDMAVAIAKGTPQCPLRQPEDLLAARIVACSRAAQHLGVTPGMSGLEAVGKMLASPARRE